MKKFFTLLFLVTFAHMFQSMANQALLVKHNMVPIVLVSQNTAPIMDYIPWLNTTSQVVMAMCPGDIFVTADPGECSRLIQYDFDLVPQNPAPQMEVSQNMDPNLVNATIYCPNGQTRYRRTFNNGDATDLVLNALKIGVYQSSNSPSITVNVFSQLGDLIYTNNVIVPNLMMTTFNVSLGDVTIPSGENYDVEVVTPPPFVSIFRMGRNDVGNTTNEALITSETCSAGQMLVSGAATANSIVMSVLGTLEEFKVYNNSAHPYESGDEFPIGIYQMDYTVLNWEGDEVLNCFFSINIEGFDAINTAMACNDQVNITLGNECTAEVSASHILKGDFYSCFNDYSIDITSFWGGSLGNTVDGSNLGQRLKVTVTAPDGNKCWGHILVEDKYGPQLECSDIYTTCIGDLTPGSLLSSRINLPANLDENILFPGSPNFKTFEVSVFGFENINISNVGVHLNISHTRVSDLVATLQAPNGQMVTLFVGPGSNAGPCTGDDVILDIFDGALNTNAALLSACDASVPTIEGEYKPLNPLSIFDGIPADGIWKINIYDISNGEGGTVNDVTLSFDQQGAVIPFPYTYPVNWVELGNNTYWIENGDNCSDAILTYTDNILYEGCQGEYLRIIERCWGGFDDFDNPANECCQTIYVYRNGLSAVNFPPNYDNIELPALSCEIFGDSIPGTDVTGEVTGDFCDNIQIVPYTDIIIPICKRSYKIIRTHKVIEWCNSLVLEHQQIIKVVDENGPEMECPADMTVSTNTYDCFATLTIERPEIFFDCSDILTYNLSHSFGPYQANFPAGEVPYSSTNANQNTRVITGFPIGISFLRWKVEDECGNSSTCYTEVHVKDEVRPTAVCHDFTIVSIAANKQAIINVESFDDGSHDNCGILRIEVRKTVNQCPEGSTVFGPRAIFCCDEIGQDIMVEMKVTDIHNNMNTCMVRASVQDKLPPYITCPKNVTLECQADYNDLSLTGRPNAVDNCSVRDTLKVDDVYIGPCGTGYVTRTWTAVDYQDLKHSCVQTITLVDYNPFNEYDIVWPQNYYTNECGAALLPENLPKPYNRPEISDDECSLIGVHYKDQVFKFVDGACEKILRTWTVLDWCTYDENNPQLGVGWYERVQIIKMHNEEPPVFESPCADITVYSYGLCEGEVKESVVVSDVCTPTELIIVNYSIDLFNDLSVNQTGNGTTFTLILPDGVHKVKWTAEDKCGNQSVCEYLITVIDGKKPTPYCLTSITTAVMNTNGRVEIWAKDYDLGSSDNCTLYEDLLFTFNGHRPVRGSENIEHYFKGDGLHGSELEYIEGTAQKWIPTINSSGIMFTCDDIPDGEVEEIVLDMSVIDLEGNIDFCTIKLILQDNANVCENQQGLVGSIAGRIALPDARPIVNATLVLESSQPEYPKTLETSPTGSFQFTNVKKNFQYELGVNLNNKIDAGVSTLDLVLIQRHILGLQLLNNPYYAIAGDVDGNEKLNSVDLVNLRKIILGSLTEMPNQQKSWKFIPAEFHFVNNNAPWPIQEKYTYQNFSTNKVNQNFVAVKLGDVNNSIVLNVVGDPTETRSQNSLIFQTDEVVMAKGDISRIPVYVEGYQDLLGYQFTGQLDPTKFAFIELEPGLISLGADHYATFDQKEGVLTTSWNTPLPKTISSDDIVFYIVVEAKENIKTKTLLTINSDITQAVAFDASYKTLKVGYSPRNTNNGLEINVFDLKQNVPNPFAANTVIEFTIPESGAVHFKILDVSGKLIYTHQNWYNAGTHSIKVDKSSLGQNGVLYYQLSAGEHTATKKMVIIE
ncbi:MAG: T9SS type A sorting domain-containing protein [Saprospiraceae bacterium]